MVTMTHSFDKDYWDQIWDGDRAMSMGTGPANPHLAQQVGDLIPGRALEAGCGAGAEAIWLAQHGWQVTGADVAAAALETAAARATASGVGEHVEWVRADLSVWEPESTYDLVTTHYAHPAMPQLEFYDRIASWVAPGGTLLIVGHLHHGHSHGHGTPAEASVTAADVTARLDAGVWEIATAEESHRSMNGTTIHDVVVRARRRPTLEG